MAFTYTFLELINRGNSWWAYGRLEDDTYGEVLPRVELRSNVEPTQGQIDNAFNNYGDQWVIDLDRQNNILNQFETRLGRPAQKELFKVSKEAVIYIFNNPATTLAQLLSHLVLEFPNSPFDIAGNFVAWYNGQLGFANFSKFKTYVLNNFGSFFPEGSEFNGGALIGSTNGSTGVGRG